MRWLIGTLNTLTAAIFVSATALAHPVCRPGDAEVPIPVDTAKDCSQNGMRCAYWEPLTNDPNTKYPLVIFLHGAGGVGTDATLEHLTSWNCPLQAALAPENRKDFPAYVMAPRAPNNGTSFQENPNSAAWVIWDWANRDSYDITTLAESSSLVETRSMIQALQAKYPNIDPDRIYVTGISMGGYGAWDLATRHPELIAAAAPACGGGSPQAAPSVRNLAVWSAHATDDDVPYDSDKAVFEALAKAGGRPYFTEAVRGGHYAGTVWHAKQDLISWLFAQRRGVPSGSLPEITFSPEGGQLPAGPVTITLSGLGADEIRYTLDGTIPNTSTDVGTLYTGPFTLDTSSILIAAAHSGTGDEEVSVFHAAPFKLGDVPLPAGAELMPYTPVPGGTGGANSGNTGGSTSGGQPSSPPVNNGAGGASNSAGGAKAVPPGNTPAAGGAAPATPSAATGSAVASNTPVGSTNETRTNSGCSISASATDGASSIGWVVGLISLATAWQNRGRRR